MNGFYTGPIDGDLGFWEDIKQFADVLSGQRDAGTLSLLSPLATPSVAPTITTQTGPITGTNYQWGYYWITGIQYKNQSSVLTQNIVGRTPYGTLSGAQSLTSKQATVSISGVTIPTGAIGWGVVRNKSAGGTWYEVPGSEQFLTTGGSMPSTYIDTALDSALVTTGPTTNSTGTTLGVAAIADTVLAGSAASIDFTNIPASFRHLLIRASLASDSGSATFTCMRLNGDTGSNYNYTYNAAADSTVSATTSTGQAHAVLGFMARPSDGSHFTSISADLLDYLSTAHYKGYNSQGSGFFDVNPTYLANVGGDWASTAAINRITLLPDAGNFVTGSRATLYGLP